MAENITLARPYAKAAFEIAQEHDRLDDWSSFLAVAAEVVENPDFHALLGSPHVVSGRLADFIIEICGERAAELQANFVRVLAENERLELLPAIGEDFERLKAEEQNVVGVELTSAVELTEAQRGRFAEALESRLGKKVRLTCRTDAELIGGAVIRAGDIVIDGSLRGRLDRLADAVTH